VIIALAIFAILGTLSVGVLSRAFDTKARLASKIEPLTELQLAETRINQDVSQIVARAIRSEDMNRIPAFLASASSIEFTRGGFVHLSHNDTSKTPQSTLRRVALRCENSKLVRDTWETLDAFNQDAPQKQILLNQLNTCSFSFISSNKTWSSAWHADESVFPTAFKLHVDIKKLGKITLVFMIPGGSHID
jgi:general secretion pathway protein J